MKLELAHALADAVLMEGYALYPYRASAPKNRFRWTFGVLAPRAWSEAGGCESWWLETQLLVLGKPEAISGQLRFFQIERRRVEDREAREVAALDDGTDLAVGWDEGITQTVGFEIGAADYAVTFTIAGAHDIEPRREGSVIRTRRELTGRIAVRREPVAADLERLSIRIENLTPWPDVGASREDAIAAAFASTHVIVGTTSGQLLSAIDPPRWAAEAAAACKNVGTFPVLVGPPDAFDLVLAAPFVMYDHAQLAPESTGDMCDACEIDELLVLRAQTMTDDEKRQARATDPRAAAILDRAEALPAEELARLHGAARDLRTSAEMTPRVAPGAKVRLKLSPRRTDAQDLIYAGHVATVAEIKHDVDGSTFFAVTIDDDPAAELHDWYGRYHYYRPDEVDLL